MRVKEKVRNLGLWVRWVGLSGTLAYASCKARKALGWPVPSIICLRPRLAKHPLIARLAGSSDIAVFWQVFLFREYGCMGGVSDPEVILDLGANCGYSSAYFLSRFPTARVLAVEPDPDNYEMCRRNLAAYGDRAEVLLGAVWSKHSSLVLARGLCGDGRDWSTQVLARSDDSREATVECWSVSELLQMAGSEKVDILKVDIERSELEIFGENASAWLARTRNICIELHGPDCEEVFFRALQPFQYELRHAGELTVCLNLRCRQG